METKIREMTASDRDAVLAMMRVFYASPAVLSDGSEAVFRRDFDACVGDSPFLSGYVLERDGESAGYAMLAHSFSTEFGVPCVWIEDLYVCPAFRGSGIGGAFLDLVAARYPDALLRLEAERENEGAIRVYHAHGFEEFPYFEMKRSGGAR